MEPRGQDMIAPIKQCIMDRIGDDRTRDIAGPDGGPDGLSASGDCALT